MARARAGALAGAVKPLRHATRTASARSWRGGWQAVTISAAGGKITTNALCPFGLRCDGVRDE